MMLGLNRNIPKKEEVQTLRFERMVGKSGRYYVSNPFGVGKPYAWAVFPSESEYPTTSPAYIPEDEMAKDFDFEWRYEFTVTASGEERKVMTDLEGVCLDDGTEFTEYLDLLYRIHGKANVKHKYRKIRCITTN